MATEAELLAQKAALIAKLDGVRSLMFADRMETRASTQEIVEALAVIDDQIRQVQTTSRPRQTIIVATKGL